MSNRDRKLYIVLGIAALIIASLSCIWVYNSYREYKAQHTEQRQKVSAYKAETNEQYSDNCLKEPVSVFTAFKCLIGSIDASREAQRSNYDLQAQQEMAEWAYALLLLTGAGLVVSVFGLTALFISLYQTRTVIKDTREIGEVQVRAYLACTAANFYIHKEGVTCNVTVFNSGQSPAHNAEITLWINIFEMPNPSVPKIKEPKTFRAGRVTEHLPIIPSGKPQDFVVLWTTHDFESPLLQNSRFQKMKMIIEGDIFWIDVFKQTQRLRVQFIPRETKSHFNSAEGTVVGDMNVFTRSPR